MAQTKIKLIADGVIDENHLKVGHTITTDNIGEGTNLYYTDARVGSYLSANSYATEGYVTTAVANLVDAAPSTLDTLNELAAALGDDPNFATTVTNSIATKLPLAGGTLTGNLIVNANVGIGTSSPSDKLHVSGTGNTAIFITGSGCTTYIQSVTNETRIGNLTSGGGSIIFAPADSEKVRISSSGNVGIGTNSPTNLTGYTTLSINNSTFGSIFEVMYNGTPYGRYFASTNTAVVLSSLTSIPLVFGTNDTERMRIDTSGNVGIGTSSPAAGRQLHIAGTSTAVARIEATSTSGEPSLELYGKNSSGTQRTFVTKYDNADVFRLGTAQAVDIRFETNDTERMRIKGSSGSVGVGTNDPTELLQVAKNQNATTRLLVSNSDSTNTASRASITTNANGVTGEMVSLNGDSVYLGTSTNHPLNLMTNGGTRINITSGGNVGIGTSSPTQLLQVGDGSTSKYIRVYGTIADSYFGSDTVGTFLGNNSSAPIYFNTNGSERMRIDASGNVGIGIVPATGVKLHVLGGIRFSSSGADTNRWSVYWNGSTGDLIVVNNISDIRAKKDLDYNIKGLETVQKLKPVKFTWKDGTSHSTSVSGRLRQYGFIAQETMEADDYLAWHNQEQDTWGIEQYESFSAVMVKAIQELNEKIQQLENKLTANGIN